MSDRKSATRKEREKHPEMDREYRPEEVERRWSEIWAREGLFEARPDSGKPPFCMVIPPPNVTGNLHIGHVLVYTIHDIVARWRRMQGHDVLWLPGTDHAGIATQMVVERELAKRDVTRHDLGRERFEAEVWKWKETYGSRITDALRRLGSTVDWSRERFTLDEGLSRAVRTVFVRLFREGLIYRDRYIVNWDPVLRSAISDLEVEYREVDGKLYTIRYPAADGGGEGITVATTRPETMLGDTGIAVHPTDERYRDAIGTEVVVPLAERKIPVVADEFVDPAFGTGAVKITPAHDPNDFEAGRRAGLPELVVIGDDGTMTEAAGAYAGLDRFSARKRVVADLEDGGHLISVKPHRHAVGHSQRSGVMIEPLVSTQWFVKVEPLAKEAIAAVEDGRTRFVPENWSKTYFEWMRNIHDWCISRQLWWGHRIPAWYCDSCGALLVEEEPPPRCTECGAEELRQEEDVLDTWFSSGLWPFSTMGWPDETPDLERYYPTSLLITAHDIIFFWVARMMMFGLKFLDRAPFADVYIHGLVRDAQGQKMSKSKGNTIDPTEVQEKYGTDAVRFTMAVLAAPGNDIPLAPERMEGYRAFANKLWNATRFVLLQTGETAATTWRSADLNLADRWILSRSEDTLERVGAALAEYRFDRAADRLYHFVWHQFCDWYIEMSKPSLAEGAARRETAVAVLVNTLDRLLRMLHPFMPFITEELWQKLPGTEGHLALAAWPEPASSRDLEAEAEVEALQEIVVRTRNLRSECGIDAGKRIRVLLRSDDPAGIRLIEAQAETIARLVRAEAVERVERVEEGLVAARGVAGSVEIAIPLAGLLDLDAERERLTKERDKVEGELASRAKRLANPSFLERAPAEIVEKETRIRDELAERRDRIAEHLAMLGS